MDVGADDVDRLPMDSRIELKCEGEATQEAYDDSALVL